MSDFQGILTENNSGDKIVIGDENNVLIKKKNRSQPITAQYLAIDYTKKGNPYRIYLDRLVHGMGHEEIAGWECAGAISTILTSKCLQ